MPVNAASRRRRWPKASVDRHLSPRKNRPQRPVALQHRIFSDPVYSAIWPASCRISADSHRRQHVDKTNRPAAGHGRLEAAPLAGLTEVPVIRLEHLSEQQAKAYTLADNKLTDRSSWD